MCSGRQWRISAVLLHRFRIRTENACCGFNEFAFWYVFVQLVLERLNLRAGGSKKYTATGAGIWLDQKPVPTNKRVLRLKRQTAFLK
jgi:hypothetical protein